MIFRDNTAQVIYNPQTGLTEEFMENRGAVLADKRLTERGRKEQKRITIAHEVGHWLFHRIYFERQIEKSEPADRVCDMDSCIEGRERPYFQTDHDWMEHQAKFFSGAILMPESAFRKAAVDPQIQKFLFITHARSDVEARDRALAKQLAHVFQVSEKAARLRMKELDISMGSGMSSVEFEQARKKFLEEQEKKKKVSKRRKRGNSCAK
jgi:Zn-dependent peptidase ImmA (M78 family)